MNFFIEKVVLWFHNNKTRELDFKKNKINIITGTSKTGKTSIFKVIDYCLLSTNNNIPDDINKCVNWYGIKININGIDRFIARENNYNNKKTGEKIYYSLKQPDLPTSNISDVELKEKLMSEFSISENIVVPYGGKKISKGSRFSFRDFMLFNTQGGDTIDSENFLFDGQNNERKREVLERIFDFALDVTSAENIIKFKEFEELKDSLSRLERKQTKKQSKINNIGIELSELIVKAKEYDLIDLNEKEFDENIRNLKNAVERESNTDNDFECDVLIGLKENRISLKKKKNNIDKFLRTYNNYINLITEEKNSLKGYKFIIMQLKNKEIFDKYESFFTLVENSFKQIKINISEKKNTDNRILIKSKSLGKEIEIIEKQIKLFPEKEIIYKEKDKYIFIGELKSKLELLTDEKSVNNIEKEIERIKKQLEQFKKNNEIIDINELRRICISELEETIFEYIKQSEEGLKEYKAYKPYFSLTDKTFNLRKPFELKKSILGSTSNDVFLHIVFFLGYHEYKIKKQIKQIPNFMILDQPSRPYYKNDDDLTGGDEPYIKDLFNLMDNFINTFNEEYKKEFQFIIFEHFPKSKLEQFGYKNIYFVEEFINGNGLLPEEYVDNH